MRKRPFPWLGEDDYFAFPPASSASSDGVLCVGGNLSPGMLLSVPDMPLSVPVPVSSSPQPTRPPSAQTMRSPKIRFVVMCFLP